MSCLRLRAKMEPGEKRRIAFPHRPRQRVPRRRAAKDSKQSSHDNSPQLEANSAIAQVQLFRKFLLGFFVRVAPSQTCVGRRAACGGMNRRPGQFHLAAHMGALPEAA